MDIFDITSTPASETTYALRLSLGLAFILLTLYLLFFPSLAPYPPGPRGFPFLGAAFIVPKQQEWATYAQWSKQYGPILGFKVFGQNIVVLHTAEAANELLENKAALSADRPPFPMLELMGYPDWNLGLMHYVEKQRLARKLLFQAMNPRMLSAYAPIQEREVNRLLCNISESPREFIQHLRVTAGSIILMVFYGHQAQQADPLIKLNDDAVINSSRAGIPTSYWVNTFPMLKHLPAWFPGAGFQREAEEGRRLGDSLYQLPLAMAKRNLENGSISPCFVSAFLSNEKDPEYIAAGCSVATTSYSAGVETTTSTLTTFILAMALNPAAQRRAQAEIDAVVGLHRLPALEEKNTLKLPFVEALIKETHRWNPPGNLGLPHRVTEDNMYQGYLLPKGTILLSNIWAILHDAEHYPQPMEFIPERYLGSALEDPRVHVFGYGRRSCPGRNLAEATVWLAVVSILAVFTITPDLDEHGKEIPIAIEYTSGVMSRPKDFKCRITPRSAAAANVIAQCRDAAAD